MRWSIGGALAQYRTQRVGIPKMASPAQQPANKQSRLQRFANLRRAQLQSYAGAICRRIEGGTTAPNGRPRRIRWGYVGFLKQQAHDPANQSIADFPPRPV